MAAGNTYVPIATQTLGSAAASVTFSSISGAYTDLVLVVSASTTSGSNDLYIRLNGDSGSNYSFTRLISNGTSATSDRISNYSSIYMDSQGYMTSANFAQYNINLMNYSNTTTYKTTINRSANAATGTDAVVGLWRNTAAVTSILVSTSGSTMITGSTFSLYGILAA
jgi:hypothetical protein